MLNRTPLFLMALAISLVSFSLHNAFALTPVSSVSTGVVYPENTDNPFNGLFPLSTFSRVYESTDRVIALDAHNGKVFAYTYNNTNGAVTSKNITISDGSFIATRLTFVSAIESDYSTFAIGRDTTDNKLIFAKFDASTMAVLSTYSTTSSDWPQDIIQTKTKIYFACLVNPGPSTYESLGVINRDFTGFNDNLATIDTNSANLDALTGYGIVQNSGTPLMNTMAPLHIVAYDTSPEKVFFFYVGEHNVFPYAPIYMKRYDAGVGVTDLGFIPDADTNADGRDFQVAPLVDKILLQIPVYDSNTATRSGTVYSIPLAGSPTSHPPENAIVGHDNNYIDQATKIPSIPSNITSNIGIATFSPTDPQVSCDTFYSSNIVGEQSLWFSYTPPEAQLVHVNMTGTNINLDTLGDRGVEFAIFAADDASTTNLKEVGCSSFSNSPTSAQEIVFGARPGITYYIMVYYIDRFQDTYHMGLYGDTVLLHVYEDQPTTILSQTNMRTLYPQTYQISPSTRVWNVDPIEVSDKTFSYSLTPSTGLQTVGPTVVNSTNPATQQLSALDDSHYYFLSSHNLLLEKQDGGFKYHPAFAAGISATAQGNYEVNDFLPGQTGGFSTAIDVTSNHYYVQSSFFTTEYTLHPFTGPTAAIQTAVVGTTSGLDQGACSDNGFGGIFADHALNSVIVYCDSIYTYPYNGWVLKFSEGGLAFVANVQLPINNYHTQGAYDSTHHILYLLYDYCNGAGSGDACIYKIDTSSMTLVSTIHLANNLNPDFNMIDDPVNDVLYVMDGSSGNTYDQLSILSPASSSTTYTLVAYLGTVGHHGPMGIDTSLNDLIITTAPTFSCAYSYEVWSVSTPSSPTYKHTSTFPDCFLQPNGFYEQADNGLRIDSSRHLLVGSVSSNQGTINGLNVINISTNSTTGGFDPDSIDELNLDTTNHMAALSVSGGNKLVNLDYVTLHPGSEGTLPTNAINAIDSNLSTATTYAIFNSSSFSFTMEADFGSVSTVPIYAKVGDYFSAASTGCYCGLDIYVYTSTDNVSFTFLSVQSQAHIGTEGITEHTFSANTQPYRYVLFLFKPIGLATPFESQFKIYELARGDGGYSIDTLISPTFITTTQYEETLEQPLQTGFYTMYGGLLKLNCGTTSYNINATFQHLIVGSDSDCKSWDIYDIPGNTLHRTVQPFLENLKAVHTIPFTKIAVHLTGLSNYNDYLYQSYYQGILVDSEVPTVNRGTLFQAYLLGQCYDTYLLQISTHIATSLGQNCGAPNTNGQGNGGGTGGGSGTTGTNSGNTVVPMENIKVPSGSFGTDWPYTVNRVFSSPSPGTSSVTFDFQSRAIPYNASVLITDSWITSQQHFKEWFNCSPITSQCLGVTGASNMTDINLQTFDNRTLYFFVYDSNGIARITAVSNGQTTPLTNPFANLGNLFGVPVLALFPVMMALLFPKSLAPIGMAIVAAIMGYMSFVGLLSLPGTVFGILGLIAGMGLLLGVRR